MAHSGPSPCVVVTGASGRLGRLVIAALQDNPLLARCEWLAAYHRCALRPTGISPRWVQFSLTEPERLAEALPRSRPLFVLHFACSMSADFNTVFRVDCTGTKRLVKVVESAAADQPVGFVFASSTAATDMGCNYGIGKVYIERHLRASTCARFRPLAVRIPVVERVRCSGDFDIAAKEFGGAFLRTIDFNGTLGALLSECAPTYDGGAVSLAAVGSRGDA